MDKVKSKPFLTAEEEEILREAHRALKDKKNAYRINVILLLNKGYSKSAIEKILLLDRSSIVKYKKDYDKGGIDKLMNNDYVAYSGKLNEDEKETFKKDLRENLFSTAKEICEHVKKKFKIEFSNDGMIKLLHSMGFSYKKTKAVPSKANRKEQEIFLKKYRKLRNKIKENEGLYFLDAVHPVYNNLPGYGWIETGKEYEVKTNTGRQRISINGLYSPLTKEVLVREDDTINDISNISLFETLENQHPELDTIYIIHDNAKYNHSKRLKEFLKKSRIKMIALPTYSPNLNLIERLWKLMKIKVVYNTYYNTFDDYRKAVQDFFNNWVKKNPNALASLMTENFHLYET